MNFFRSNKLTGFSLDEIIPHQWVIDDLMVFKDLSVACMYSITLPPYFVFDEELRTEFHRGIASFLNTLDDNYDIQFIWNMERNCDDILAQIHKNVPNNKMMRAYQREVLERMASRADKNLIRRYKGYVAIVRKPALDKKALKQRAMEEINLRKKTDASREEYTFGNWVTRLLDIGEVPPWAKYYKATEWETLRRQLLGHAAGLESALTALQLAPVLLKEQDWVDMLYEWWNPDLAHKGVEAPKVHEDLTPVSEYFALSPLTTDRAAGYFTLDNKVHRILTLRTPPADLQPNIFEEIFNKNTVANLRIVININSYNRDKRIAELQAKLPILEARAAKDLKLTIVINQVRQEILNLQSGEESTWHATTLFHTWADTKEQVDENALELKRLGKMAGRANVVQEEFGLLNYWLQAQPGWTRDQDLNRQHAYSASQVTCLIPLTGHPEQFRGEKAAVVLESANGGMYNFNPLDYSRLNNFNCLIMGTSGTGKSFLAGSILMGMQSLNARVIAIDLGGSYTSLCEALQGNYVTMDPRLATQTINPFSTAGNGIPDPQEREQISRFLEKAMLERGQTFDKQQASYIDEVLTQTFLSREGKPVYLSNFREQLYKFGKPETAALANTLGIWCQGGKYGALFDGPTKLDFDKPFSVFDMVNVKDNQDIAPLTIMSIMNNVYAMAANYPNEPKILLMDEAWFLTQDPVTAKFVAECFRTFRKLNVSIIGVSQGIEEWIGNASSSILTNVSTFFMLKQTSAKAAGIAATALQLNIREASMLTGLVTVRGEYSQCLFVQKRMNETFSTILLNRPTPLQYAIMTTNPIDKQRISQIKDELRCTQLEARLEFAKRHPKGVT